MKKSSSKIIYLFAVLLLLTSCGVNIKNTENISSANEQKNDKNAFYIEGELPDIGEFSGKQKRFYNEYTPEFIPSDKYGQIYPFIGKSKLYETPNDEGYYASQLYSSYGFCTEDGTIVSDANVNYESVLYTDTADGFGYYTVRNIDNENPEDYDVFEISKTLIIPKSGKWCLELDSGSWLSSAGGGVFSVTEYAQQDNDDFEGVRSHVYDYDKNLLFTLNGVESVGKLSCGLMLITKWHDYGAEHNFIDIKGNIVLGPFSRAQDFNEYGITCVADENDDSYIIDTEGNKLNEVPYGNVFFETGAYDQYNKHKEGVFSAKHKDNDKLRDIYSADGTYLGLAEGGSYVSIRLPDNGDVYYGYTNYDNRTYADLGSVWKRLSDNKPFVSVETNQCPNEYYGTNNIYVSKNNDNSSAVIFDYTGKTLSKFDDFNSFVSVSPNEKYLSYISGKNNSHYDEQLEQFVFDDQTKLNIYDLNNSEPVVTFDSQGSISFTRDSRYAIVYLFNDSGVMYSTNVVFLYDLEQNKILFENATDIRQLEISGKDYYIVCTPTTNTLYDDKLNTIIKTYNE